MDASQFDAKFARLDVEYPRGTTLAKLFIHLFSFAYTTTRAVVYSLLLDWTLLLRHPLQTITKILLVPVVVAALSVAAVVLYVGRWFGGERVGGLVTAAYGNKSVANCGLPDPLGDAQTNVFPGLEKMTSGGAPGFDFSIAKSLLFFASLVYEPTDSMKSALRRLPRLGKGEVEVVARHYQENRFATLFQYSNQTSEDKTLVISFRGTSPLDLDQWLLDANMSKTEAQGFLHGAVHRGFFRALFQREQHKNRSLYEALIESIIEVVSLNLREAENGRHRLYVTGHGLGGALATLFFARLLVSHDLDGVELGGAYTFGSPRVGNLEFRNQYTFRENQFMYSTARMYRVVNANDPVPRIPFGFDNAMSSSFGSSGLDPLDYCHIGTPVILHPYESGIPDCPPTFTPVTVSEFVSWNWKNFLSAVCASNLVDFVVEWVVVADAFADLWRQSFPSPATTYFAFQLATQATGMADHLPSRYRQNLVVREKALQQQQLLD